MQDMSKAVYASVTTTVMCCARCGGKHEDIEFILMQNPIDKGYPYWAACPNGMGPILCNVETVPD